MPDKRAEQQIGNLKVYCNNHELGCKETRELRDLDKHKSECQFEVIPCKYKVAGCTEKLQRMEMDKHDEAFKEKHLLLCLTMLYDQDEVLKEQDEKIRKLESELQATVRDKNDEIKKLQNDICKKDSQLEKSSKKVAELEEQLLKFNQNVSADAIIRPPTFESVTLLIVLVILYCILIS